MEKRCVHCGIDCSGTRRFKDPQGRYACGKCYDALKPPSPPAPANQPPTDQPLGDAIPLADDVSSQFDQRDCPRCAQPMLVSASVCPHCRYDTTIGAAPIAPAMQVSRPCPKCGYDLKGLSQSASCPECGADLNEQEHVARKKKTTQTPSFYIEPLQIAAGGLVVLVIADLAGSHLNWLLIDGLSIIISVPAALVAYWFFSVIWAGGFDQAWGLAALNFLAVFSVTTAVEAICRYVNVPLIEWPVTFFTYYGLLMSRLDLDNWKDAFVLTIMLRVIQFAAIFGLQAML